MKYLISLSLLLFATQAFSKMVPTGDQLVRFVCQGSTVSDRKPLDFVVILEQTSSKVFDIHMNLPERRGAIDGPNLVALDNGFTGYTPFRMRIYHASLISDEKTEKQIIEELLNKEADLDSYNRRMDYTGAGSRWAGSLDLNPLNPKHPILKVDSKEWTFP